MSMVLVRLGRMLPFMTASAIAFSVCGGVGGCVCPNSSSMILIYTALCAIMYSPASSASVADDMTFLMMCAMFGIAPLFGGMVVLLVERSVPRLCCVLWASSTSLHCCVLLIPCCLHDKRARRLPAWPDNRGVEGSAASCIQSVWMSVMQ